MESENDISEMCRLCLAKEQVNVHIFEEESEEKQIFLKISTCLPIKISLDDRFPKKICTDCSCKLDAMYQFWNKSISSESQLLTWLDLNSIENVSTPDNRLNSINLHSHIYVKEEPIECLKTEHDIKLEVMEESYDDESYNQPINELPNQESSSHCKRKRDTSPECEINSDDDPLAQDTETKILERPSQRRRRSNRIWMKSQEFDSSKEAQQEVLSKNIWKIASRKNTLGGCKVEYRCSAGKYRVNECPAGLYLLYHSTSNKVSLFTTQCGHKHDDNTELSRGLSHEIKTFIREKYGEGIQKPNAILAIMRQENIVEPPKAKLVTYLKQLRLEKYGNSTPN